MLDHSVLIHTHQHARFIRDAVESLLHQTEPPHEIVVYDDASTDQTVPILRGYGERIRLIQGGPASRSAQVAEAHALQAALAASRGRLIFLLDAEDRFKPEKIQRYTAAFENHPDASLVQAPLERIDARGDSLGVILEPRKHVVNHLREIYRQQDIDFFYPASALAFSRYFMERMLPLEVDDGLPLWTDARLAMPAVYYGRVVTLPDPLTDRRCLNPPVSPSRRDAGRRHLQEAFSRAQVFNAFCRRHGLRTISPWRSTRFYLQLVRQVLPACIAAYLTRHAHPIPECLG